jgi:hypothetical protein
VTDVALKLATVNGIESRVTTGVSVPKFSPVMMS